MFWVNKVVCLVLLLGLGPIVCHAGRPGAWNDSVVQNASFSQVDDCGELWALGWESCSSIN